MEPLVDVATKGEVENLFGLYLGVREPLVARELCGELYSIPRYVISDIGCMPSEFRLFQVDGYENFFVAVANEFMWIVEKSRNDLGTGVSFTVLDKWDKLNQLFVPV